MNPPKKIAALHDLSCLGRCALTVIIPTLSVMGYQVVPVPTALLSTHTGGYTDLHFCDLTDDVLIEGAKSYFENNVSFNGKHQDKKLFQRVEIIKISPRNTHDYEAVLTAVTEQWNIQERPQNIIPYFNNCCPVKISGVG